jgi:hypothetical protein
MESTPKQVFSSASGLEDGLTNYTAKIAAEDIDGSYNEFNESSNFSSATGDADKKIMGMKKPLFFGLLGVVVVGLGIGAYFMFRKK